MSRAVAVATFLCVAFAAFAQSGYGHPTTVAEMRATVRQITAAQGRCSAVMVAPGKALTAWHCKQAGEQAMVDERGNAIAKVSNWQQIAGVDLASIDVPGADCPCAPVEPGIEPVIDEPVIVIGYPYGLGNFLTRGEVQFVKRHPSGQVVLFVNAPVAPGNSGGGMFIQRNGSYVLVGIVSMKAVEGSITMVVEPQRYIKN